MCDDVMMNRFAEMSADAKNRISHRSRSLKLLQEYLAAHPDALVGEVLLSYAPNHNPNVVGAI
jgi:hypothetical protein